MSQTLNRNVKNCYWKKNVKSNEEYNTFHGPLFLEWIDGRYWSPKLICHANSGLYWNHVTTSYLVGCIDMFCNISGLKQSELQNPLTRSRVGTSLRFSEGHSVIIIRQLSPSLLCWGRQRLSHFKKMASYLLSHTIPYYPILSHTITEDAIRYNIDQMNQIDQFFNFLYEHFMWCATRFNYSAIALSCLCKWPQ